MKHLLSFGLACLLVFSGCSKAPVIAADNPKPNHQDNPSVSQQETSAVPVPTTPVAFTPETHPLVSPSDIPLLEQINQENIKVATAVRPSIVRIAITKKVDPHIQAIGNELPFQFHFGPRTSRSFPQNEPSFGSGVIISKDGCIVTNNHVVEGARDIEVQLKDKTIYAARVVASDAMFDIAVLKVDTTGLPALPWGDSDKVEVGEQVFAIGNPFDLDNSVSKGIVSAKGRNLPDSGNYEDYIQTDAAINPGNSGGALINIHGELIGINAAIASTSRFNMGVGFAIPSNLVRYAVQSLLRDGKMIRGYLGVKLPETVDEGVLTHLGLKNNQGALLAGVLQGSPADAAKLHAGDFITQVDGRKIESMADLRLIVAQIPIGKEVEVQYIRDGASLSTKVKVAAVPEKIQVQLGSNDPSDQDEETVSSPSPDKPKANTVLSGIQVTDLDDKTKDKMSSEGASQGWVTIVGIQEGSIADERGLQKGDLIESACVNRGSTQEIKSAKDFTDLAKGLKPDQSVVLLIRHNKTSSFVYLAPRK